MPQSTGWPFRHRNPLIALVLWCGVFTVVSAALILYCLRGSDQGFGTVPYVAPQPYNVIAPINVPAAPYAAPTTGGTQTTPVPTTKATTQGTPQATVQTTPTATK